MKTGILHILHNAEGTVLLAFDCKDEFFGMLQKLQNFFRHKYLRELFCAQCLVPPYLHVRDLYEAWPATYIEWRWGSLLDVLRHILFLKASLRLLWDSKKIERGRSEASKRASPQEQQREEEEAPTRPREVGEVIHNPKFLGSSRHDLDDERGALCSLRPSQGLPMPPGIHHPEF